MATESKVPLIPLSSTCLMAFMRAQANACNPIITIITPGTIIDPPFFQKLPEDKKRYLTKEGTQNATQFWAPFLEEK